MPIAEVCDRLSRSRASLCRDIEDDRFPWPVKLGRSSRWRESDLGAFIARGRVGS